MVMWCTWRQVTFIGLFFKKSQTEMLSRAMVRINWMPTLHDMENALTMIEAAAWTESCWFPPDHHLSLAPVATQSCTPWFLGTGWKRTGRGMSLTNTAYDFLAFRCTGITIPRWGFNQLPVQKVGGSKRHWFHNARSFLLGWSHPNAKSPAYSVLINVDHICRCCSPYFPRICSYECW